MKLLLEPVVAVLKFAESVIASVARPWWYRQGVLARMFLTMGTTPRYRPPTGRPRRRR